MRESKDAEIIHAMQIKSFMPLLEKYQDYETSPVNEPIEKIINKINQSFTDYYIIKSGSLDVGCVRIVKKSDKHYRVGIIFVLPEHQGKRIAFVEIVSNGIIFLKVTSQWYGTT